MRVDLGPVADVPEGRAKCATADGKPVALFKVGAAVFCLDNRCTHVGGPLCRGLLREWVITCPLHGSRFDVRSGALVGGPARSPVAAYPTTIEGGKVFVDLP